MLWEHSSLLCSDGVPCHSTTVSEIVNISMSR